MVLSMAESCLLHGSAELLVISLFIRMALRADLIAGLASGKTAAELGPSEEVELEVL